MLDNKNSTPLNKEGEQVSIMQAAKEILNIAGPALVTLLSFYLVEVITIIFTGHLGDPAIIAGAGLGSM